MDSGVPVQTIASRVDRARPALVSGPRPPWQGRHASSRRVPSGVVRFVAAVVVVASIIGAGGFIVLSQESTAEAQRSAEEIARVQGLGIVQPVLTDPLLQGDSAAVNAMDRVV